MIRAIGERTNELTVYLFVAATWPIACVMAVIEWLKQVG